MKTRDIRWRQSTAGHKEELQGHEERVFSWQLFSSIPLFSGPCLPDNATSKLCQSSALHSVHDKILLINNCAFTVADTSNLAYGYCHFTYFIPEVLERNTFSWMVTYTLQQLIPTKTTTTWKKRSVFWVAEQQKAIERNTWLRKTDFSPFQNTT